MWQHTITVVSGEHTGSGRIILGGSFSTTGAPITVKTGASAQVSIADGTGITLTNTSSGGPSLKSDGSLILAGGAGTSTLNAPGGIAGGGSLTIGAAEYKGMTVDTSAITTQSTTIESGHVKVTGNIAGSVAIKGGNVKATTIGESGATTIGESGATTIGESGATTIDGGTIIGAVADGAKNSEGEPVYPVTLKVSDNPESYKDQALTVLQSKKTSKTSTATRQQPDHQPALRQLSAPPAHYAHCRHRQGRPWRHRRYQNQHRPRRRLALRRPKHRPRNQPRRQLPGYLGQVSAEKRGRQCRRL